MPAGNRRKLVSVVTRKPPTELEIFSGDPALDLANTLEGPHGGAPTTDSLTSYGDLAEWAAHAGVVDAPLAARLARAAGESPDRGAAVHARAVALRGALYDAFATLVAGGEPARAALAVLAREHGEAAAHARLEPAGARFELAWEGEPPDRVLWPVAQAAVDLLRTGPLDRLKACVECRGLFLDASRNHSRRWCSMNDCGGRDKVRRYRARRATGGR